MSVTPRSRPLVYRAGAIAAVVMLAACARPLPPDRGTSLPLRTADIVHAPAYRDPVPAAAAATEPAAVVAVVEVPAPQPAPAPLAAADVAPTAPPAAGAPPAGESVAPRPNESASAARPPQPGGGAAAPQPAPGRWSVQVGVFAVPANAQAVRSRVAQRLAQAGLGVEPRIERIGDRTHVLVGELPDRAAAQALAAQLRQLVGQDVVILRR